MLDNCLNLLKEAKPIGFFNIYRVKPAVCQHLPRRSSQDNGKTQLRDFEQELIDNLTLK